MRVQVFYVVQGLGEEPLSKQLAHPNVFSINCNGNILLLGEVQKNFPLIPRNSLSSPLSFAFRSTTNKVTCWNYIDQNDANMPVPVSSPGGNHFFIKVQVPPESQGLISRHLVCKISTEQEKVKLQGILRLLQRS